MKIFAHDGMIINLEDVSSVIKQNYGVPVSSLRFKFISKGSEHFNDIITSDVINETADAWLAEIAKTMRED